jgi:hypothetical protein
VGYFCNLKNTTQSKQSPKSEKSPNLVALLRHPLAKKCCMEYEMKSREICLDNENASRDLSFPTTVRSPLTAE